MSDWVCLKCGTMNDSIMNNLTIINPEYLTESARRQYDKVMKLNEECENKGESLPEHCKRCMKERL